jgi:hypothetical protein
MMCEHFELEHPSGVLLSRALTEDALLKLLPDVAQSKNDMRTGWVWYRLPPIHDGEYLIVFGLGFHNGLLEMMALADGNARFGTNWNEWSEEKERLRAKSTESWLYGKGFHVGTYPWGSIGADFDPKGGKGSATVLLRSNLVSGVSVPMASALENQLNRASKK